MKNNIYLVIMVSVILFGTYSCKKNGGQDIGVVTDIDGNTYKVITLGTQTWMMKNLETTRYADSGWIGNGALHHSTPDSNQLYFSYSNDSVTNLAAFGRLYTWAAVTRSMPGSAAAPSGIQGPCPNGWHVPSEAEYTTLINDLGGNDNAGGPMKGNAYWNVDIGSGQSASGFNALPGGERIPPGIYGNKSAYCYFWTATDLDSNNAYIKVISGGSTTVGDTTSPKNYAYSCRCVQN